MDRTLGYEPYMGFKIYAFSKSGTDHFGRGYSGFVGWAKRESDGKVLEGVWPYRTLAEAEDDMKGLIDAIITKEKDEDI